jgi:hypothetical protein
VGRRERGACGLQVLRWRSDGAAILGVGRVGWSCSVCGVRATCQVAHTPVHTEPKWRTHEHLPSPRPRFVAVESIKERLLANNAVSEAAGKQPRSCRETGRSCSALSRVWHSPCRARGIRLAVEKGPVLATPLPVSPKPSRSSRASKPDVPSFLPLSQLTYWVPAYVKEKRFHNWLENAHDWAVSRSRFWGTPIPIWARCDRHAHIHTHTRAMPHIHARATCHAASIHACQRRLHLCCLAPVSPSIQMQRGRRGDCGNQLQGAAGGAHGAKGEVVLWGFLCFETSM